MDLSRMSELEVIRVDAAQPSDAAAADDVAAAEFRVFGAVQRTQDQIAAEVQLVEGATGRELWSERYYRPFGDLFAIRDEIETKIAAALSSRLGRAKLERDADRYSRSVAAYDAFLRAKTALLVPTEDANDTAKDLYGQAIRLDAAFARAYGGLALIHAADYRNQWAADGDRGPRPCAGHGAGRGTDRPATAGSALGARLCEHATSAPRRGVVPPR